MEYLSELTQYHFPNISIDLLNEEPYRSYTQIYCSLSATLQFYRGFVRPTSIVQAKIYRAVRLACGSHHEEPPSDSCMVFRSPYGLIIKVKEILPEFNRLFDLYLSQPDSCIFLPQGYDRLDRYEFPYYHDLLLNFKKNNTDLLGTTALIRRSEHNSDFLFLCLEEPTNLNLASQWRDYLQGGLRRTIVLTPGQLPEAFRRFRWSDRSQIEIVEGKINLTVKCTSFTEFTERTKQIQEEDDWILFDLKRLIENDQEAFGFLRRTNSKDVIPLIGTSWVCARSILAETIATSLQDKDEFTMLEGAEVFTQTDFSEMSSFHKSSLIQSPTGTFYSVLGLVEQIKTRAKLDPLTRQPYPDNFLQELELLMAQLDGPFLTGFPSVPFEPKLITVCPDLDNSNESTISFYIQMIEENEIDTHLFWRIPDLRRTEFAYLTFEAIRILVLKWSDQSLFKGYRPERTMNPNLIFSPAAYYVFEKNSQELDFEKFPIHLKDQADRLLEQIYILQTRL